MERALLEPILGSVTRIDFQTKPDGWFLDDGLLTMSRRNGPHCCAWSIKSNKQVGASDVPSDFVEIAWAQYLHEKPRIFERTCDFMGLLTTPLDIDFRASTIAAPEISVMAQRLSRTAKAQILTLSSQSKM